MATYRITWSIIFKQNLPTLVPPNFWTTQLLLGAGGAPLTMDRGSALARIPFSMVEGSGGSDRDRTRRRALWKGHGHGRRRRREMGGG